jgi:site-specific DNA-methyltransferase (adenine-specific)
MRTGDRSCTSFKALTEGCLVPSVMRFHKDHLNYIHPTQKPLELIKRLVEMLTPENGIVLDPFAGSFTTAIACLETGRRYVCIEKEDDYFEIGKNRISQWHNDKLNNCGAYELPEDIDRIKEEKSGQLNLF